MRTPLNIVLALLLVLSAMSLVTAQYRARGLFIDLESATSEARRLEVEWNQLRVDQTNYSKHSLIEAAARRDLDMVAATPARSQYITLPTGAPKLAQQSAQQSAQNGDARAHEAPTATPAPREASK